MIVPGGRRVGGADCCPAVGGGIISAACVHRLGAIMPSPDNHFAAGPYCGMQKSAVGRIGGADGCPDVRGGIISPACVQHSAAGSDPSPNDHFTAGPYRRVPGSGISISGAGGCPTIRAGVVSCTRVQIIASIPSTPDEHLAAGPHRRVPLSGRRRVDSACSCPGIDTRAFDRRCGRYPWKSVTMQGRSIRSAPINSLAYCQSGVIGA